MSTLALALMLVILSVVSFFLGVAMMARGISQKVIELKSSHHHNGMKWIKFVEWIEK